jgi:dienelactone hydrolase
MIRSTIWVASPVGVLIGLVCPRAALAAGDPFLAYLQSSPKVVEALTTTSSGSGDSAVVTKTFTFESRGGVNVIYAIESAPQKPGRYPGLLVLHGGGGNAETVAGTAATFAQHGYVTLAVDLPHLCQPNCSPKTTGPWRMRPLGEAPRFEVEPGPEQSVLMDAELAGVDGFNWLRSQPNVDTSSMGIFGYSWGGYSTTFLSGLLGDKVKAAYAVFGCGFYDKGSFWKDQIAQLSAVDRDVWLSTFDAGRRAQGMKAAYFLEGESNDTFFWPEAVQATFEAVPGNVNHVWGPNLNHHQLPSGPKMIQLHMDYYLKGVGAPFAKARVVGIETTADQGRSVTIDVDIPAGATLSSVELYYSKKSPLWQDRTWTSVDARGVGGTRYVATLGADIVSQGIDFYGFVTDSRSVTTATSMYDSSSMVPLGSGGAADGGGGDSGDAMITGEGSGGAAGAQAGSGSRGAPTNHGADSGASAGGAGSGASSAGTNAQNVESASGCSCSVFRSAASPSLGWFAALGLGISMSFRRRQPLRSRAGRCSP